METKSPAAGNKILEAAHKSLASQSANANKGFDVTRIDSADPEIIQNLITSNDLSALGPKQRVEFIKLLCASIGLNPLSQPLKFVEFKDDRDTAAVKKKLSIYATKDCAEQLRKLRGVSVTNLVKEIDLDAKLVIYTAYLCDATGRTDVSTGAVALTAKYNNAVYDLTGQARANAIMKAETKAKRRGTLSICGLGFLDETEIGDLPDFKVIETEIPETDITTPPADNNAAEAPAVANSAKDFAECMLEIDGAKSKVELSGIKDRYLDKFTSDQLKQKVRDKLNVRLEEINRAKVAADTKEGATAGAGLFQKAQPANA